MKTVLLYSLFALTIVSQSYGQLVSKALQKDQAQAGLEIAPTLGCGSHHLMEHIDKHSPGYLQESNKILEQVAKIAAHKTVSHKKADIITIPVVFHVLYNSEEENLPDSVLFNQLEILQQAFRHSHKDTGSVRNEFKSRVGDSEIEFVMAEKDPEGNATNGIVRQSTDITHFGGVLPYNQNELPEIQKWFEDSFYNNVLRITQAENGGSKEWDPYTYLNVWIGDLRILEPELNNFEELLFVALATPPRWHEFWPNELMPTALLENAKGVFIHYVTVGGNNPNKYPAPYGSLNPTVRQGKVLVHEVGHYLGLRHIWGDAADCDEDDFIDDTPSSLSQSGFQCLLTKNTCIDSSQGPDLPDMIENYMDYSSGTCAVAFTKGQIAVMREVYDKYRKEPSSLSEVNSLNLLQVYPNPAQNQLHLTPGQHAVTEVVLKDLNGRIIYQNNISETVQIELNEPSGVYLLEASTNQHTQVQKVIIH